MPPLDTQEVEGEESGEEDEKTTRSPFSLLREENIIPLSWGHEIRRSPPTRL